MCVPVRLSCSRRKCTSNVRGSTVALRTLPLTVMEICTISASREETPNPLTLEPTPNFQRGNAWQLVFLGVGSSSEPRHVIETHCVASKGLLWNNHDGCLPEC